MVVMVVFKIDGLRGTSKDQNRETKYTLPTSENAYLVIRVSFHWHNFLHLASLPLLPSAHAGVAPTESYKFMS
jgi:hypothetical protein